MVDVMKDTRGVKRDAIKPRSFSKPYWEATRDKRLIAQYCRRTGKFQFFPRPVSIFTGRRDLEWRELSGRGRIFSYTIARRAPEPFRGHEPFFIATVTLEEGINVIANVVNCPPEKLSVGLDVKPYWHPLPDGAHLLMFQPSG